MKSRTEPRRSMAADYRGASRLLRCGAGVERGDRVEPRRQRGRMRPARRGRLPATLELVGRGVKLPEQLFGEGPELDPKGGVLADFAGDRRELVGRDSG